MSTSVIPILEFSIYLIVGIMGLLVVLYLYLTKPKKEKIEKEPNLIESNEETPKGNKKIEPYGRFQGELSRESIFEFMEFEEIVDDMIVRKKRNSIYNGTSM